MTESQDEQTSKVMRDSESERGQVDAMFVQSMLLHMCIRGMMDMELHGMRTRRGQDQVVDQVAVFCVGSVRSNKSLCLFCIGMNVGHRRRISWMS